MPERNFIDRFLGRPITRNPEVARPSTNGGAPDPIALTNQRRILPETVLQTAIQATTLEGISTNGNGHRALTIPENGHILTDGELRARERYDPREAIGSLIRAFGRVNHEVVGREALLNQTLYAMLTREHQLIFSRAGIAKSLYAMSIFSQFEGAQTFSIQMTKGTTEDALVGPVNIEELKKGNIRHNTEGTIVDADFAFLDEVFDANDVALRSLLGILNERTFRKGKQQEQARLHTAIATTNFLRSSDLTEAVIDRFAFRATLMPDYNPYHLLQIDEAYGRNTGRIAVTEPGQKVPFEYVRYIADIVEGRVPGQEIQAPSHILFMKNAVIAEYQRRVNEARKAGDKTPLYISPRTIAKSREVLNTSALLRNRGEVTKDDLESLRYAVCTIGDTEGQEDLFDQAARTVTSDLKRKDLEVVDIVMEVHSLLGVVLEQARNGGQVTPSFAENIRLFFGLPLGELTFGSVKKPITRLHPDHPLVNELKESFIKRVEAEQRKSAGTGKQSPAIF